MISIFDKLQGKYVSDFEGMSIDELKTFLSLLEDDIGAPYRERRIRRIKSRIDTIERVENYTDNKRELWRRLAEEDKAIKSGWERLGATFRTNESMVTWEYEGKPFYRWFSGVSVEEEIHRVRKADKRLREMIV